MSVQHGSQLRVVSLIRLTFCPCTRKPHEVVWTVWLYVLPSTLFGKFTSILAFAWPLESTFVSSNHWLTFVVGIPREHICLIKHTDKFLEGCLCRAGMEWMKVLLHWHCKDQDSGWRLSTSSPPSQWPKVWSSWWDREVFQTVIPGVSCNKIIHTPILYTINSCVQYRCGLWCNETHQARCMRYRRTGIYLVGIT